MLDVETLRIGHYENLQDRSWIIRLCSVDWIEGALTGEAVFICCGDVSFCFYE